LGTVRERIKLNRHAKEALNSYPGLLKEVGYTIRDDNASVDAYLKEVRESYPQPRGPRIATLDEVLADPDFASASATRESWLKLACFFQDPKTLEEILWIIPTLQSKQLRRTPVPAPGTKRHLASLGKKLRDLAPKLGEVIWGRTLLPEPLMSEAPRDLRHLPGSMIAAGEFLQKLDNPPRVPSAPRTVALRILLDWIERKTGNCHFTDVARLLDAAFYAVTGDLGPGEDALKTLWHKKRRRRHGPPIYKKSLRTTSGE
jgi:hypothetical protein